MKSLLFFTFSILVTYISAQVVEVHDNTLEIGAIQLEDVNKSNKSIKGSPYTNDAYIPAKVNDIKKTQFVRLNATNNTLEVKISPNKIIVLDSSNDFNIQFLDGSKRRFTTTSYPDENLKKVKAILELIAENENYTLYKRERKKLIEARKGGTYTEKKPAEYVDFSAVYYTSNFSNQSKELVEIPRKKKKFFDIFQNHSKEINQFAKQEKLSITQGSDLSKIFDFYFEIKK